jgi:superoxide reductase
MEGKNYEDKDNPSKLEKKHIPIISIGEETQNGEKEVIVEIGEISHPMEEDHHIEWLELKKNDEVIGRVEFSAKDEEAKAVFSDEVSEGDKYVAHENCNLHGLWYGELEV